MNGRESLMTQQVVIPDTQAGTYYVLLQGDTGSTGGKVFTLSAQTLPLQVSSASPSQAGNTGTTTLTVEGAEFTARTIVSLEPHGGGSPARAPEGSLRLTDSHYLTTVRFRRTIQATTRTPTAPNRPRRPPRLTPASAVAAAEPATPATTSRPTPTTSSARAATAPRDSSLPAAPSATRSNSPTRRPPQVPADNVVVTEQLSPNLDWSTFQLGTIGFGSYVVNVPPGLTSYSTRVDATATLGVYVDIDASLNLSTGLLTVTFTSLDPTTLDTPSNPLVGFLPPDTNPPNGEGYINYTIQPKAGLATGAAINAQASIVFDTNAAIATPQITNTIDAGPPTSTVAALPATTTTPSFTVSWSGSDGAGPGHRRLQRLCLRRRRRLTRSGSRTPRRRRRPTPARSATPTRFYSVATDNVGLVQPTPTAAQATTTVVAETPPPRLGHPHASASAATSSAGDHDQGPGRDEQEAPGDRGPRDLQRRRQRRRGRPDDGNLPPGDAG